MNDPTLIGPCGDYEHDLVELHDGELCPERARIVRLHIQQCLRCRSWAAQFTALDSRLAADLPRPTLSPDFDARLRQRLSTLTAPASQGELRSRIEREHDSLLAYLRRFTWRRAVLGAIASTTAMFGILASANWLLSQSAHWMSLLGEGPERWVAMGTIGSAIAVGTLAWSTMRRGVIGFGGLR